MFLILFTRTGPGNVLIVVVYTLLHADTLNNNYQLLDHINKLIKHHVTRF